MTSAVTSSRWSIWTWLCGLSSLVLLLTLITFAVHIRIALGRWPAFGENYNSAIFRLHELTLVGVRLFTVYAAPLAWLILLFFRSFRISWRVHLIQTLAYGIGWVLILTAGKWDPTPFTNWLLD